MVTTIELIEKYLLSLKLCYKELKLSEYSINGSIIKITYSYLYDWGKDRSYSSDNYIEVDLLDYIAFVFNCR
jgi:hypothetical protein